MAPADLSFHRIVYASSAVGVLPAHELDRILLRARVSNQNASITGLLLFHEGAFLQCIEGQAAGVISLMERIRRDRRHTDVAILESAPCAARAFPGWPMGYVAPRNLSASQRAGFAGLLAAARDRTPFVAGAKPLADHVWPFLSTFRELEAA